MFSGNFFSFQHVYLNDIDIVFKKYVIRLHNPISMNIFFTERSVFLYNCK